MELNPINELSEHDQHLRNVAALDARLQCYTPQYTFVLAYLLTNIFLFFYSAVPEFKHWPQYKYRPWIIAVARGFGYCFNFNVAFQMILACRSLMRFLRKTRASLLFPLDYAIPEMHSIVGITAFFNAVLHAIFHSIVGFSASLWAPGFGKWTYLFITGAVLLFIFFAVVITSLPQLRKSNFEAFFITHLAGTFLILGLLVFHGLHKGELSSYKWIIFPLFLYILDRFTVMASAKTASVKVKGGSNSRNLLYDDGIVRLSFKRPFEYRAGQYAQLCIPKLSETQWHPFTFASAPHEENVLFFIKKTGTWTAALHKMCKYHLERRSRKRTLKFEVRIRGPYGAPAEHAAQYDRVLLISGGVGATPFCSITKQMTYDYLVRTGVEDVILPEKPMESRHSPSDTDARTTAFLKNPWSGLIYAGRTVIPTCFLKGDKRSPEAGISRASAGTVPLTSSKNDRHKRPCDIARESDSSSRNWAQLLYTISNSCTFNTLMLWILMFRLFVNMMSIAFDFSDLRREGIVIFKSLGIQVTDFVLGLLFAIGLLIAIVSEIVSEKRFLIIELLVSLPVASVPVIVGIVSWSHVEVENGKLSWYYFAIIWPMNFILFLVRYFRALGEKALLSGRLKKDSELCSSVDFIWATKTSDEDAWLTEELKRTVGQTRFVRLHRFITREEGGDTEEGMVRAHYGRPNWSDIFAQVVRNVRNGGTVGIFFCGPVEMAVAVKEAATLAMFDSRYRGMRNQDAEVEHDGTTVDSVARSFNVRFVFRRERY